jgi:hypothetical protein
MEERRGVHRVLVGNPKEKERLEGPRVDGRILKWIYKKWDVGVRIGWSWIKDRGRWQALVNAVMNLRVS